MSERLKITNEILDELGNSLAKLENLSINEVRKDST